VSISTRSTPDRSAQRRARERILRNRCIRDALAAMGVAIKDGKDATEP